MFDSQYDKRIWRYFRNIQSYNKKSAAHETSSAASEQAELNMTEKISLHMIAAWRNLTLIDRYILDRLTDIFLLHVFHYWIGTLNLLL